MFSEQRHNIHQYGNISNEVKTSIEGYQLGSMKFDELIVHLHEASTSVQETLSPLNYTTLYNTYKLEPILSGIEIQNQAK